MIHEITNWARMYAERFTKSEIKAMRQPGTISDPAVSVPMSDLARRMKQAEQEVRERYP